MSGQYQMFDPSSAAVWLDWADRAYVSARLLWFSGLLLEAPVSGHRALELYLKAYLVGCGVTVAKGHAAWGHCVPDLARAAARYDAGFQEAELFRRLSFFDRYFEFVRYPSEPGSPEDGSLVWFSFDANIAPLDECVAWIRPRIALAEEQWPKSYLAVLVARRHGFDYRALTDSNVHLETIVCSATKAVAVQFDAGFSYDQLGC